MTGTKTSQGFSLYYRNTKLTACCGVIGRVRESRNPKKVIRVALMESYGEIGRVPVNLCRMELLAVLLKYKKGSYSKGAAAKRVQELEAYREKKAVSWPELKEQEQKNLLLLLENREGSKKQTHLTVTCFGGFQVMSETGKKAVWRTRKTMELCACLFDAQGRSLYKDVLMEKLWPDSEPQKSSVLLNTTVSYLRRALEDLECGHVLEVNQKKYRLSMEFISSDYGVFQETAEKIESGRWEELTWEEALLPGYKGAYMQGEDYLWALDQREYLEHWYLRSLKTLAEYYEASNAPEKAVLAAKRALETDPFSGEVIRILIRSLKAAGEPAEAQRQYEKFDRLWREEIGQGLDDGEIL